MDAHAQQRLPVTDTDTPAQARQLAGLLTRFQWYQRSMETHMILGTAELRILWLFSDEQPRTLREIGDALRLEQSTVNRQINAAVDAGMLERLRPEGGHAYVFAPTQEGVRAFERDVTTAMGAYEAALLRLGDDAATLCSLLEHFVEQYREVVTHDDDAP